MRSSPFSPIFGAVEAEALDAGYRLVSAMGLTFAGPLGVAAGVDRDGQKVASLDLSGFGHIEVGTVTPETSIALAASPPGLRIGVNFGSSRQGLDNSVIADYCAALRNAYVHADYLCANLTSPRGDRDGNSAGVGDLVARLKVERDHLAVMSGVLKPLLLKVAAGETGAPLPGALVEASRRELDGIVLVSSDLRRIESVRRAMELTLISVGGVATAEDVAARISVGASLVQVHAAFVAGRRA